MIWSYPGLTPPPALFDAIRAGLVGGVIFFGENISRPNYPSQIQAVTAQLAQAQADSGIGYPLLLMTDQEGGIVQRLPGARGSPRSRSARRRTRLPQLRPRAPAQRRTCSPPG